MATGEGQDSNRVNTEQASFCVIAVHGTARHGRVHRCGTGRESGVLTGALRFAGTVAS